MSTREESKEAFEDDDMLVGVDDDSMTGEDDSSVAKLSVAKKETKAVAIIRVILFVALVALAIAISLTAYFENRNAEVEEFKNMFEGHALKVSES